MNDIKLMVIAYNSKEYHTVAYLMNMWYAQYIEGCMEESGVKYNQIIGKLPKVCLDIMTKTNVFDKNYTIPEAQPEGLKIRFNGSEFVIK